MKQFFSISFLSIVACLLLMLPSSIQAESLDVMVEGVTEVKLTFTPANGGTPVVVLAEDNDGAGPNPLMASGDISLKESTDYSLSIEVKAGENDLTNTILQEGTDYLFFFGFTDEIFGRPAGDGNVDQRADPINYDDMDTNNLPIGLSSSWSTECGEETLSGTFRLVLKHQPGMKTETSSVDVGNTDFDISWNISVAPDPDAPPCENEEEIITDVILTFTPAGGGDAVVARAQDPDGEGPLDLEILDDIVLMESTQYTMGIQFKNEIEGEDITEEIMAEDDEHMIFFAFTEDIFRSPVGDGNVDNRDDPVNYNDFDENGFPVGLSTNWRAGCGEGSLTGMFRIILKHQPGIKSATSTAEDGNSDIDLSWNISITLDPNAPPCENEEEIITDVTLTFTPVGGGADIIGRAIDPDGEGPLDLEIIDDIELVENTTYDLSLEFYNGIAEEDITEEVEAEGDEHMIFFQWTDGLFSDPSGDGNTDNRSDPVNYSDMDVNSLPIGLKSQWKTGGILAGTFRIVLKHQPGMKTATSTVEDGSSDIDLTWNLGTVTNLIPYRDSKQVFKLWPNPVQHTLNWDVENIQEPILSMSIHDMTGRLVRSIDRPSNAIDIQELPSGYYVIRALGKENSWVQRFSK